MTTDVASLLPMGMLVADMVPDNPGRWLVHCHVAPHLLMGMEATYEVIAQVGFHTGPVRDGPPANNRARLLRAAVFGARPEGPPDHSLAGDMQYVGQVDLALAEAELLFLPRDSADRRRVICFLSSFPSVNRRTASSCMAAAAMAVSSDPRRHPHPAAGLAVHLDRHPSTSSTVSSSSRRPMRIKHRRRVAEPLPALLGEVRCEGRHHLHHFAHQAGFGAVLFAHHIHQLHQ